MKTSGIALAVATAAGLLVAVTGATAQVGDTRSAPTNRAFGTCDGFAQEAVLTNTETSTKATASSSFVTLPSSTIDGGGSGDGVDLYTVTLSGETFATGGGNIEVQAQVSINGGPFVNMNPNQPDTFHNGNLRETHTMTWCREIDASDTEFRIVWRKNFGGTAYIDDFTVRVERSS